jgi:hypothetical protein
LKPTDEIKVLRVVGVSTPDVGANELEIERASLVIWGNVNEAPGRCGLCGIRMRGTAMAKVRVHEIAVKPGPRARARRQQESDAFTAEDRKPGGKLTCSAVLIPASDIVLLDFLGVA